MEKLTSEQYSHSLEFLNYPEQLMNRIAKEFNEKIDALIKDAIARLGFNPDDEQFVRNNITLVIDSDPFKHVYYRFGKPDEVRLISIQKEPVVTMTTDKFLMQANYY